MSDEQDVDAMAELQRILEGPNPFEYRAPTTLETSAIQLLRSHCKDLYGLIMRLPASRERSLAITKLEEVSMWLDKAVVLRGMMSDPERAIILPPQSKGNTAKEKP